MIHYNSFVLDNGLRVFVHEDHFVPTVALNLLYDVGSRDERPDKTGFAHLFEHLMFGGSANIPQYDEPLQRVGGENNAFTSADITNYYLTLPAQNIETGFWLESDRMLSLSFNPEVLEVQRKVVIEEYKQRYLNQPYGDVWLRLRPMAYKVHPYQWATIGKDISHIENATMDDVKEFFFKYYRPNNAILVVAGNTTTEQVKRLADKWFSPIPAGDVPKRQLPREPQQTEARSEHVEADVPVSALYKVWHMCDRLAPEYYATDLLSDVLGRSKSSRLYHKLVEERRMLTSVSASILGSIDNGLFTVSAKPAQGVSLEEADQAIGEVIAEVQADLLAESELQKVKNQAESTLIFGEMEVLNRAMGLAYAAVLGNPDLINQEADKIQAVTAADIRQVAQQVLRPENCSTLYYHAKNK
ncbi:M16 family metallopeptidase [Rhodoflexus caldus]|uniref:M16 family metallopeptidase n=1 Tax=Rhodoflexus caldus TaxID=2891236 RepID=UPI002029BAE9|nr:pitrilysin family protein [Rhodoflexus caldus]